ncbi:hypothetical protein WJX79_001742 [Trebouxia sp. C0005]
MQHQSPGDVYQYLDQLPRELVACRRILQYSFVLEYFWQASPDQVRLLEGLQAQLGSLVEQLSMPLALLPGSNLLLEAAPDLLSHQLSCVPAASHPHEASHRHEDLQQSIKAVSQDAAPADGTLTLSGIIPAVLKQQFMFAVAVHEDAKQLAQQLQQMRQAKQSLLQAVRTGAFSPAGATAVGSSSNATSQASNEAPAFTQVAQAVKYIWQGWK